VQLLSFTDYRQRYGDDRLKIWMAPGMGNIRFQPESVLLTGSHLHFYDIPLDWRKDSIKGKMGTNPAIDLIPLAIYFQKDTDALLWLLTWGDA
jgi:hypothetical protein